MKFKVTVLGEPDYAATDFEFDIYPEIVETEFETLDEALHFCTTASWNPTRFINYDGRWTLGPHPRMS
jgi:hypothetical protein